MAGKLIVLTLSYQSVIREEGKTKHLICPLNISSSGIQMQFGVLNLSDTWKQDVTLRRYNATSHTRQLSSVICFLNSIQLSPEYYDRQTTAIFRLLRALSPVDPSDFQILVWEQISFICF